MPAQHNKQIQINLQQVKTKSLKKVCELEISILDFFSWKISTFYFVNCGLLPPCVFIDICHLFDCYMKTTERMLLTLGSQNFFLT